MKRGMRAFNDRFLASLQYRDFRYLWTANAFAQAAAWALIVTRGWLVFEETESAALVGATTFAAMAPQFIVPPIVGVLADRIDRWTSLVWSYAFMLSHTLVRLGRALLGWLVVWMWISLSVVNGVARAGQLPTSQALSATLVPKEKLLNALSLQASTQHGSRMIGPGIVTPVLSIFGAAAAFLACTLFYGLGLLQVLRIEKRPVPVSASREGFFANLLGGFAYVYSQPTLRFMVVLVFFHCGLTMAFESLLPTFSDERLTSRPEGFGTLMMGVGAGAFVASIFVSGITTVRARGNVLVLTGLASGLGQVALGFTGTLWMATVAAAVMGGAQAAFMTMGQSITQSTATDEFRGRVASINTLSLGGVMAVMNLANGSLDATFGAATLLKVEGLIFALIMLGSLVGLQGRRIYGRGPGLGAAAVP